MRRGSNNSRDGGLSIFAVRNMRSIITRMQAHVVSAVGVSMRAHEKEMAEASGSATTTPESVVGELRFLQEGFALDGGFELH